MALSGGAPRAIRAMSSAMTLARACSMPSVLPETCGVKITLGSSWKGWLDGITGPAVGGYRDKTSSIERGAHQTSHQPPRPFHSPSPFTIGDGKCSRPH